MILYVDETENDNCFIVAGLLVKSEEQIRESYKKFKNRIKGIKIPSKYKAKVYTEFKSVKLDRDYSKIKYRMLEEIVDLEGSVIYSIHIKKSNKLNQVLKESVYITLLSSIVASLEEETTVVFDAFNKSDFESNIIRSVETIKNVKNIYPNDSQKEPGLQYIDNICSVIRLYRSGEDQFSYYEIIKNMIIEV